MTTTRFKAQLHVRLLASESPFRWFDRAINEELGRNRKPKILPWKKRSSILVRSAQNFFTDGFDSGQPSRCQNILQLNLYKLPKSLFISFRKMVRNVFWTEYNYTQFHCLKLDLWLATFKICLKILSRWPRFVWSHCKSYIFKGGPFLKFYWLAWAPLNHLSELCVYI